MKRFFLTALVAAAFAFGMSACCNNNTPAEETADTAAEMCEHHCHHHDCNCADSTCAANHCEGCTDTNCAAMHHCCHHHEACADSLNAEGCCKAKAEAKECCKEGNKECHKECCKHKEQK